MIRNFAWLLFLTAKLKIFTLRKCREDITETAFLLYACIKKVLLNLPKGCQAEGLFSKQFVEKLDTDDHGKALEEQVEKYL